MPSKNAIVEQPDGTKPPVLTAGIITPETARAWERACRQFFLQKNVPEDDQVKRVAWGMHDPRLQDWYLTEQDEIDGLSFAEYMVQLREKWLEADWQSKVRNRLLGTPQGARNFYEWAVELQSVNALLRDDPSHLTLQQLRYQIEATMNEELRADCLHDKVNDEEDFHVWLQLVKRLDERLQKTRSRQQEALEQYMRLQGKGGSYGGAKASSSTRAAPTSARTTFTRLPSLTNAERELLRAHAGCFKCRKFYVTHRSTDCPDGFPPGEGYKTLVERDALAAKPINKKSSVGVPTGRVVNAVMPVSAVLGEGTDSGEECVAPLTTPHFLWDCLLDGPKLQSSLRVQALIDHGSHVVLIDDALVDRLGLRRRRLNRPMEVSVALQGDAKNSFSLSEYVKLACSSLDSIWTSRVVRALIAPGLCTPLLLGGPFLSHNKIVIDHQARTCIAKDDGYDLLHPPDLSPPPPCATALLPLLYDYKRAVVGELNCILPELRDIVEESCEPVNGLHVVTMVKDRIEVLASVEELRKLDATMKQKFADRFPADIPHIDELPTDVLYRVKLKDANKVIQQRSYPCPRKYRDAWHTLLEQHLAAGRLRPSSSAHASPSFIIPKADPTVLPRWVNDFRMLNANTVADNHPLPRIDEILADCARGKVFAKIDMTNSFFQTRVHPDDIHLLGVHTPFGLYEWTVMPMGVRNAPATHQRRMTAALRPFIGKICHVYLDDIIIWSSSIEEHITNVETVLTALRQAHLYCSPKKTALFCTEVNFLGHVISARGVEADASKVSRILDWPVPQSSHDVKSFLGLVRYIAQYLPDLANYTRILTPLTTKDADLHFPRWSTEHQRAFQGIKDLVVGRKCLTVIDHENPGENVIFVTTDASDWRVGAVLSFGPTWESARPVAFDSCQLTGAETRYPTHEKELLAIVKALKKWRVDLLGARFVVYTDHRTLENFDRQPLLSRRQARWQEFLGQYDFEIRYVKGEDNTIADALSRLPRDDSEAGVTKMVAGVLSLGVDKGLLAEIRAGYATDGFAKKLLMLGDSMPGVEVRDGLLYLANRLVLPQTASLRERFFQLAHDSLGHFGADKSYAALRDSYYWPNMRKDLQDAYIPSCSDCQRNKSPTTRPAGPLHPLPVPDARGDSVAIDFIGPLPEDEGYDMLVTMTDRLNSDIRLAPCRSSISAESFAHLFFDYWYCENGLPLEIVSDRDKLFISRFWKALHKLTGVKLKLSSAYHPETDGASERTNKTITQALRYYVERSQKGWVKALPKVRFDFMNTVNASTGFAPFQLHLGRSPRLLPPLVPLSQVSTTEDCAAHAFMERLHMDVLEARDALLASKVSQAASKNKHRSLDPSYRVGDLVLLSTKHRRRDYMQKGDGRVAKFMPRFDGPYRVTDAHPATSTYTLDMPSAPHVFPTFHTSQLRRYVANDPTLFPTRVRQHPAPVVTADGSEEATIDRILEERRRGRGWQYLVRWFGYGPEHDEWVSRRKLEDCEALDVWLQKKGGSFS